MAGAESCLICLIDAQVTQISHAAGFFPLMLHAGTAEKGYNQEPMIRSLHTSSRAQSRRQDQNKTIATPGGYD